MVLVALVKHKYMKKIIKNKKKTLINSKPKFIVIEGGEGSGKTTVLMMLKDKLGDKVLTTREPGGTPYAEVIREATIKNPLAKGTGAETTLCLMFASRYDNLKNMIIPSLKNKISVITDRFDASSYAYQIHAQSKGKLEKLFWNLRSYMSVKPDLYIFFDVDPKEGVRRANTRNQVLFQGKKYDHFDDREIDFHKNVRKGYLKFFKKVPHRIIDANQPIEKVFEDFKNLINIYITNL
jgi:dTMP kinase